MKATISRTEQGVVLRLSGSADYEATVELRQAFDEVIEEAEGRVVCDLSELDFICSDALSRFICARLAALEKGGYLRLVNPQQRVLDVLQTTRLDKVFGIFTSAEAAHAAT